MHFLNRHLSPLKIGALAVVLTICGQAAHAAAPPPATVGAQAPAAPQASLGDRLAVLMFDNLNLDKEMSKAFLEDSNGLTDMGGRPEWAQMFAEALTEEFQHDRPAVISIFGRGFEKYFTPDELRAGLTMLQDPAVLAMFKAGAEGKEITPGRPGRAAEKAASSPAGRSFLDKTEKLEGTLKDIETDLMVELLPGMLRRFADKAEAFEIARKAKIAGGAP